MNSEHHAPTAMLDRIMGELAGGHLQQAICMITGMFDALAARPEDAVEMRKALLRHPLCQLLEDKTVSHEIGRLGFAQALACRRELAAKAIERAWQAGWQICLLGDDHSALQRLEGQDLSNVSFSLDARPHYSLVVAPQLADGQAPPELRHSLRAIARRLAPGGLLLLSAFVPGHLGHGWRTIFEGGRANCHSESELESAAAHAGLAASQFRDGRDCMIWAEMRQQTVLNQA